MLSLTTTISIIDIVGYVLDILGFLLTFIDGLTARFHSTSVSDFLLANARSTHHSPYSSESVTRRSREHPKSSSDEEARVKLFSLETKQIEAQGGMSFPRASTSSHDAGITIAPITKADSIDGGVKSCTAGSDCDSAPQSSIATASDLKATDHLSTRFESSDITISPDDSQSSNVNCRHAGTSPETEHHCLYLGLTETHDRILLSPQSPRPSLEVDEGLSELPFSDSLTALTSTALSQRNTDSSSAPEPRSDSLCKDSDEADAPLLNKTVLLDHPLVKDLGENNGCVTAKIDSEVGSRQLAVTERPLCDAASAFPSISASTSNPTTFHEEKRFNPDLKLDSRSGKASLCDVQLATPSLPQQHTDKLADTGQDNIPNDHRAIAQRNNEQPELNHVANSNIVNVDVESSHYVTRTRLTSHTVSAVSINGNLLQSSPTTLPKDMSDGFDAQAQLGSSSFPPCSVSTEVEADRLPCETSGQASQGESSVVVLHRNVPASLSRPEYETVVPRTGTNKVEPLVGLSLARPTFLIVLVDERAREVAAAADETSEDHPADHSRDSPYACDTLQAEKDSRVHAYRPDSHTIAALVVEERNMIERKPARLGFGDIQDDKPKAFESMTFDTSFIPRTVQQHAESQNKRREAVDKRNSHRGKRGKKQKKTGRFNKERLCAEKVLQSLEKEAVNTPRKLEKAEEMSTAVTPIQDVGDQDMPGRIPAQKKPKRQIMRPSKGLCADSQSSPIATPSCGQTLKEQVDAGLEDAPTRPPSCLSPRPVHYEAQTQLDEFGNLSPIINGDVSLHGEQNYDSEAAPIKDGPNERSSWKALSATEGDSVPSLDGTFSDVASGIKNQEKVLGVDCLCAAACKDVNQHAKHAPSKQATRLDDNMRTLDDNMRALDDNMKALDDKMKAIDTRASQAHMHTNFPIDESHNISTPSVPYGLAAPSLSSINATSAGTSALFDVESYTHTLLTRSMQQQQPQTARDYFHQASSISDFAPLPRPGFNEGIWPHYAPEPFPEYYHPIELASSGLYPFYGLLPEHSSPYYGFEPYAGFQQPQHYESFYNEAYEYEGHFSSHPEQSVHMVSYHAPNPEAVSGPEIELSRPQCWEEPKPIELKDQKPWYLQPLVYEEEMEREFEARGPSQRMRLMKVCRKYGL